MSTAAERQAERVRFGLLEQIQRHTIDDDYAMVAQRPRSDSAAGSPRVRLPLLLTMLIFSLLVVVAFEQTSRNAVTDEDNRRQLIDQINARRTALDARRTRIVSLTATNARLQQAFLANGSDSGPLGRLRRLTLVAGGTDVTGPGVRLTIGDKPGATDVKHKVLDTDLQRVVNGLWQAGAEAVAVNGIRITSLTAIRTAGTAITVDYISLSGPYVVEAIGNADTLPARFAATSSGAWTYALQRQLGLRLNLDRVESITLPAGDPARLRFARSGGAGKAPAGGSKAQDKAKSKVGAEAKTQRSRSGQEATP